MVLGARSTGSNGLVDGEHAAGEVHHVGEAPIGEELGRPATARPAAAQQHDAPVGIELVEAPGQLAQRDVHRAGERALCDLGGLADVDELGVTEGDAVVIRRGVLSMGRHAAARISSRTPLMSQASVRL